MVQSESESQTRIISVHAEQKSFPPYDAFHGTPDPMLWRRVTIETPRGSAVWEQTDYGHPGKLNPWDPRGIASTLTSRLDATREVAEALGALLD